MTPYSRHRMRSAVRMVLALLAGALLATCAPESAPEDTAESAPTTEDRTGMPRVFFIEPRDGDTVPAGLVQMRFGAENFVIEPVGEGEIHEGAGHLHVGFDTDCLPAGTVIPTANPWVHFGQAQMEFELRLEAGTYKLCLQVGDGEHRTLPEEGMAELITITVE